MQPSAFDFYSHHLRSEKIVDDDWEFGHEDGDPYEDLAHFLRWLASYGPDYINAVVNTQDKPDSAMATTQAAKESLETALENIMDIEETTKNIISAEPIATSTLNDFKKNDAPVVTSTNTQETVVLFGFVKLNTLD